jgi:hypothetical protein
MNQPTWLDSLPGCGSAVVDPFEPVRRLIDVALDPAPKSSSFDPCAGEPAVVARSGRSFTKCRKTSGVRDGSSP